MYKFHSAFERYGYAKYPMPEFYEPEFAFLTPEVEKKIMQELTHDYVNKWGKKITIKEYDAVPEMKIPASKCFIFDGGMVKYI